MGSQKTGDISLQDSRKQNHGQTGGRTAGDRERTDTRSQARRGRGRCREARPGSAVYGSLVCAAHSAGTVPCDVSVLQRVQKRGAEDSSWADVMGSHIRVSVLLLL